MIAPNMGSTLAKRAAPPTPGLADALFTSTQQRVLGRLFVQPERSFYGNELIAAVQGGSGAVLRELSRLVAVGLIRVTRVGNQKHYQANPDSPIFEELRGIALKTFGVADVLRAALAPLAERIETAFVYGSVAKGSATSSSDIDLMVIGTDLAYPDLIELLQPAERQLSRPINPTLYTPGDFRKKREAGNAFLNRVLEQPRILVMGGNDGF